MSPAVTGPIPSIVSSCSTRGAAEADRAFFGAARGHRGAAGDLAGDENLLAVAEPGREVDRFELRVGAGAPGAVDRVGDPRPRGQPVDAGTAHGAGHVDDDVGAAARRG